MATYRPLYKCRLCGEIFHVGAETDLETAARCMSEIHVGIRGIAPLAPNMTETHYCRGEHAGSLGVADFQGWEAVLDE